MNEQNRKVVLGTHKVPSDLERVIHLLHGEPPRDFYGPIPTEDAINVLIAESDRRRDLSSAQDPLAQ